MYTVTLCVQCEVVKLNFSHFPFLEALFQVSGAKTAYFPKDQDCITTKSSSQLQNRIIEDLTTELKNKGIKGEPRHACLVCGRPWGRSKCGKLHWPMPCMLWFSVAPRNEALQVVKNCMKSRFKNKIQLEPKWLLLLSWVVRTPKNKTE